MKISSNDDPNIKRFLAEVRLLNLSMPTEISFQLALNPPLIAPYTDCVDLKGVVYPNILVPLLEEMEEDVQEPRDVSKASKADSGFLRSMYVILGRQASAKNAERLL
mgnify:CR=1 FL=1